MFIDIHSHIKYENSIFLVKDLLTDMEKNNIEKRVISSINCDDILENNRKINDLCELYPDQLIGCAVIDPKRVNAIEQVEEAISLPYIKLLEFDSFEHGYFPELQNNLLQIFDLVKNAKLIVKVFVGIGARAIPQQWEIYAKAFPTIQFVFLHMGCFDYGYTCVDVAKRNKNIYLEISNQYELQILRKALKEVDADRILFGSKYPERLTKSSLHLFDMLKLDDTVKEKIYYRNAERLIKIYEER